MKSGPGMESVAFRLSSGKRLVIDPSAARKPVRKHYGYGIVGKSGRPWWHEDSCVCADRAPMLETVANLNEPGWATSGEQTDQPYRVVKLFYMSRGK